MLKCIELDDWRLFFRVLTFNIHNGINWYGEYNLKQIADFIREIKPDFVGIQEASCFWSRKTHYQDMEAFFKKRLEMFSMFSATLCRTDNALFGNLVLSSFPIIKTWTSILPGSLEPRNFITIQVQAGGIRINFLTTHLGLADVDRLLQIRKIIQFSLRLGKPLIITGDFNEQPNGPVVTNIKKNWVKLNSTTQLGTIRRKDQLIGPEVDMVFTTSDFILKNIEVCDNYLSDHLPVIADLELKTRWAETAGQNIYQ